MTTSVSRDFCPSDYCLKWLWLKQSRPIGGLRMNTRNLSPSINNSWCPLRASLTQVSQFENSVISCDNRFCKTDWEGRKKTATPPLTKWLGCTPLSWSKTRLEYLTQLLALGKAPLSPDHGDPCGPRILSRLRERYVAWKKLLFQSGWIAFARLARRSNLRSNKITFWKGTSWKVFETNWNDRRCP